MTFDTLEATRKLREAGFDEKQAEAVVRVMSQRQDELATRMDLRHGLEKLELRITVKSGAMLAAAVGVLIAVMKAGPL